MKPSDHYVVISADTHAGGSHEQYRNCLDPKYRDDFDAWREKYRNPFKDLKDTDLRVRNWDTARRNADQEADGVVGEVIFPNTVPPFFPTFVLFAQPPTPDEYELRLAGIRAHNRWMVDFVAEQPKRRAGIGQIFLNNVDDAIEDVKWCHANGLRGGVLISSVPPTCDWIKPLYHPDHDPLWAVCEDLGVPVNAHSGTGGPKYQTAPAMPGHPFHLHQVLIGTADGVVVNLQAAGEFAHAGQRVIGSPCTRRNVENDLFDQLLPYRNIAGDIDPQIRVGHAGADSMHIRYDSPQTVTHEPTGTSLPPYSAQH